MLAYKYSDASANAQWYHDYSLHLHQQTLTRIKDRSPTTSPSHKSPPPRPKLPSYLESERQDSINRENRILMSKLLSISESKALRRTLKSVEPRSLNVNRRKREEQRIRVENEALGRRLIEKVTSVSKKRLELECYRPGKDKRKPLMGVSLPPLQDISHSQGLLSEPNTVKGAAGKQEEGDSLNQTFNGGSKDGGREEEVVAGITLDQYLSGKKTAPGEVVEGKKKIRGRGKANESSQKSKLTAGPGQKPGCLTYGNSPDLGFPVVLETVEEYSSKKLGSHSTREMERL